MVFNLGKKYEAPSESKARSIIASILVTVQELLFVLVTLALCLFIIIVFPKFWIVCVVLLVLCVLTISNLISRSVVKHRISNLKAFKVSLLVQYILIVLPVTIGLFFTIVANISKNADLKDYDLNFKSNVKVIVYNITDGFKIGNFTIPAIVLIVLLVFLTFGIFMQKLLLDYDGCIYIKADDDVVYPTYSFSLIDKVSKITEVDYDYLKSLQLDDNDYIVTNKRYCDFYIYGEEEQYFHIETFVTKEEKGKLKKVDIKKSEVFVYDTSNFEKDRIDFLDM